MNKIWTSIIIFCFIFSIITNNFRNLINSLFSVPETSIKLLFSIGGLIIIYNGIFQIAIDSNMIKKISFIFKPLIKKIYKTNNEELLDLLCSNFTANLLGLGVASTPISLNILSKTEDKNIIHKLIGMNITCFTIFPFTIISLRSKLGGDNNLKIWILLIVITLLNTIFNIFLNNIGEEK